MAFNELEQAVAKHAGNRKLGFEMDKDIDEVVRNFIADDLDEQMKLVAPA